VATAPDEASAAIASGVRRSRRRATRASSSPSRSTPEPAVSCAAYRENSEQSTAGAFAADVVGSSLDSGSRIRTIGSAAGTEVDIIHTEPMQAVVDLGKDRLAR